MVCAVEFEFLTRFVVVAEGEKGSSEFLSGWMAMRVGARTSAERMTKKSRLECKAGVGLEVRKKESKEWVDVLVRFGLLESDAWEIVSLSGGCGLVKCMDDVVKVFESMSGKGKSVFATAVSEGELFKCSKGCIHSRKPTKALVKEFMRIMGFLVWSEVVDFGSAKEQGMVERHEEMKKEKEQPSDALLSWMSGIRVPWTNGKLTVSVNFPELSVYLMNQEWGIHDGESLKEKVEVMSEVTDGHRLCKWVPVEHVVAVVKATLDLKGTSVPRCEVDLLFHSPGEVQRKELVHLLKVLGLTDEEVERMMLRDALFGDCSHAFFVNHCTRCFENMVGCPIDERKMMVLMRACVFMERGMEGVLKVDRILRFAHSREHQRMAERCQLPAEK